VANDRGVPAGLGRSIREDLRPVRPTTHPARGVWLALLLCLPAAAVYFLLGLRDDAGRVGNWLLWGGSLAQVGLGLTFAWAALELSIPRLRRLAWKAPLALLLAAVWMAGLSTATWNASPGEVPAGGALFYWWICFSGPTFLGLPLLVLLLLLAARARPLRPQLVGASAGLAAGLLVDAFWRTYCSVAALDHVLGAHAAAVAALTVIGFGVGSAQRRRALRAEESLG
jgi:hypothetical protein